MEIENINLLTKDVFDEETVFDLKDNLEDLPYTPNCRNDTDSELSLPSNSQESQTFPSYHRDGRIRPETMLSRVSAYASVSEEVLLEDLFEYVWPDDDSETSTNANENEPHYVVQELLSDFLKIKSFKRRYPNLTRRVMDAYERSWLQNNSLVPSGRAELGLTALCSDEVMSLLQNDFPDVHVAVSDLFRQRRFKIIAELQKKQYEAARIERGEARAEAARRRALESASDFNRLLVTERHRERRYYWDLQTMQIHVPKPEYRMIAEEVVLQRQIKKGGLYPVAVIPGQFTENFIDFSPTELSYFPLSRALYTMPCQKPKSPPPLPTFLRYSNLREPATITFDGTENAPSRCVDLNIEQTHLNSAGQNSKCLQTKSENDSNIIFGSSTPESTRPPANTSAPSLCSVCKQLVTDPLCCSNCCRVGHPRCLELPESMAEIVKTYAWCCMDCKYCMKCNDTGNEEQMMFCDRCDRGYHAFCVGLSGIPEGNWDCPTCDPVSSPASSEIKSRRSSLDSSKIRTPERKIRQNSTSRSPISSRHRPKNPTTPRSVIRSAKRVKIPASISVPLDFNESSCATMPELDRYHPQFDETSVESHETINLRDATESSSSEPTLMFGPHPTSP